MSESRFTAEQQAALYANGKTIVSASAGSGKTTVMIQKILNLVRDGCAVRDILAVTFTKKAAAQMKEKLCKSLIETINKPETTAKQREVYKKQLLEVGDADISTIHSFCAKLLRRNFYALGLDNTFRVIGGDDAEGKALKNAALDELFEEAYDSKDEDFMHLLSVYWRKKSDNMLRGIFMSTYETLRSRADYREYLEKSGNYDQEIFEKICIDLLEILKTKCQHYKELVEKEGEFFNSDEDASQQKLIAQLLQCLDQILATDDYFSVKQLEKPEFERKQSSKKFSEEKKYHIERLAQLKEKIVKIYDKELSETLLKDEELSAFVDSGRTARAWAKYLLLFDEKYEKFKREENVLDYNDLEHKTLRLLQNQDVVTEIKAQYKYVFVDEYQDVNPVQEEIISKISGENLFLVGDVKQSIYGFRGSKSEFFIKKQRAFGGGEGQSLAMKRNFRSSDAVLDAVNKEFVFAMTPQQSILNYKADSWMERGGRYEVNSGKVEIHFAAEEKKKKEENRKLYSVKEKSGAKAHKETNHVKLIRSIIDNERAKDFYDADLQKFRRVEYSDIVILSRKKQGQITETVAALSALGVPVTAASAINVCDYAEVKCLIDLLSLIDNMEQDVPLCSVLLSSIGGLTVDDLAQIRLAYPQEYFFRNAVKLYAQEQTGDLGAKLQRFYAYCEELRALSNVLDAGELLTKVMSDSRMEAELLSRENGEMSLKRIRRFLEETTMPEPLSVHAFLRKLQDMENRIEYSENGGENSVKVLTMHASKGLEYPIVILDDLSKSFRRVERDEVFVEEKYGLAPKAYDTKNMTRRSTLLRRLYDKKEEANEIADLLNLFYVAMTRAKYGLHMIYEKKGVMPDVRYAASFADFTDFELLKEYIVEDNITDVPLQERAALVFRPNETLVRDIIEAVLWQYPYAELGNFPVKSSPTALLENTDYEKKYVANSTASENEIVIEVENEQLGETYEEIVTNTDMGLAYHSFLEHFDFGLLYGRPDKEQLSAFVDEALEKMEERDAQAAALLSKEKLMEILLNPVFYELEDMRLYKEQKFLASLPIKETYAEKFGRELSDGLNEEMIFQGAIDLLAVGEKEVRVIDYKYSKRNKKSIVEHYRPQLELYKKAVAKVLKIPQTDIRCSIVNICLGYQVDLD